MVEEKLALLKSLGFSTHEASIYLTLIEKSEGEDIEKISTSYGMPPSKVKDAVNTLFERGFVKIVSNRLEAIPPRQALAKIQRQHEEGLKEKIEMFHNTVLKLQTSLEPIYWERRLGIRPEEILEPLQDLAAMELQTVKIISHAEKFVFIFAESFGWYPKVREELFRVRDKGVEVKVIMMVVDKESAKRARELQEIGAEVRHCIEEWYPVRGTLVDGDELVFLIWATEKKEVPKPLHFRPHYTKNAGLIRVFTDAFEKRWEAAKPFKG